MQNGVQWTHFPIALWEVWFCSSLGVPINLIGPPQQCASNVFRYDSYGDRLQTCQVKSTDSQVHEWSVYRLGALLGSVGHRVKIHKITSVTGKERGDIEIRDHVVLRKPRTLLVNSLTQGVQMVFLSQMVFCRK